jgi:hypothetical protein
VCCSGRSHPRELPLRTRMTAMLCGRPSITPRACGCQHSSFILMRFHTRQVRRQYGVYYGLELGVKGGRCMPLATAPCPVRNPVVGVGPTNFHLCAPLIKDNSHMLCHAHAVPLPCHAMPCRAPAILRQCHILRESPRGGRKYPNC